MTYFRGVPRFFRGCCCTAGVDKKTGYLLPGYHLALHINRLMESDSEEDENRKLRELYEAIPALRTPLGNHESVVKWLRREFPRCMALIPQRSIQKFLEGFYMAFDEGRIDFPPVKPIELRSTSEDNLGH